MREKQKEQFNILQIPLNYTGNTHFNSNKLLLLLIVGAGSAGCVLANRLSEDLTSTVLIVEAGGSEEENEVMHIPALPGLLQNTKQDWAFRTVPQKKSCQGLKDQVKFLTLKII